ncbi:hypothetical protein M758_9G061000 [Ceratodon purpureus]|nr:hypothetical protein M758_9G061000 [Ceratodon purpureus]
MFPTYQSWSICIYLTTNSQVKHQMFRSCRSCPLCKWASRFLSVPVFISQESGPILNILVPTKLMMKNACILAQP